MSKVAVLAVLAALAAPGMALAAPGGDEDRYGPPPAAFVDPAGPYLTPPMLTWPGKAAGVSPPAPAVERAAPPPAFPAPPRTPAVAAALPTSIYAPPPSPLMQAGAPTLPATAVSAQAQTAGGQPPRLYSLHREFGLTPDPAPVPLPTQFFTPSADLAEPPPPPPPHVLPAGQQAMTASAHARADIGDPDAAPATLDTSAQ